MAHETDTLVVGGGATGAGIARDLARRGVDVTLVERGGIGSGTSGRSHGLLHSGARYAEADRTGAEECLEENEILRDIAGACIRDTGGLFVQLEEDDPAYFEEKRAAGEDIGIPTETLEVLDRLLAGLHIHCDIAKMNQYIILLDGLVVVV